MQTYSTPMVKVKYSGLFEPEAGPRAHMEHYEVLSGDLVHEWHNTLKRQLKGENVDAWDISELCKHVMASFKRLDAHYAESRNDPKYREVHQRMAAFIVHCYIYFELIDRGDKSGEVLEVVPEALGEWLRVDIERRTYKELRRESRRE